MDTINNTKNCMAFQRRLLSCIDFISAEREENILNVNDFKQFTIFFSLSAAVAAIRIL